MYSDLHLCNEMVKETQSPALAGSPFQPQLLDVGTSSPSCLAVQRGELPGKGTWRNGLYRKRFNYT